MKNDTAVSLLVASLVIALMCVPVMAVDGSASNPCEMVEKMLSIHNTVAPMMGIPTIPFPQFPMCYPKKFSEYADTARVEAIHNYAANYTHNRNSNLSSL